MPLRPYPHYGFLVGQSCGIISLKGRVLHYYPPNIYIYAKRFFLGLWPSCSNPYHTDCSSLPPAGNESAFRSRCFSCMADSPWPRWCCQAGSGAIRPEIKTAHSLAGQVNGRFFRASSVSLETAPILAASAVKPARRPFRHRACFIDAEFPSVKILAVPHFDGFRGVRVFHLNEAEPARAAAHPVGEHGCRCNRSGLGKGVAQSVIRRIVRQIADIEFYCHIEAPVITDSRQ